ncbi:MAG: hypothetical protein ACOYMA_02365 [Bacteroidia bacterium]
MTDKELDKLVNQKLAQQTFEFDDAYWQKASALIDSDRANSNKLVWLKYAFYLGAIGIFGLMGWFLLENSKANEFKQQAENVIESKEINKPIIVEEKQANAKENLAPKQLESNIEKSAVNTVFTPKNKFNSLIGKSVSTLNNNTENKETPDLAENEIINSNFEEVNFIDNKSVQLLVVEISNPAFDFKNIDFVKSPNNSHKNSGISTYLNASLEVGTNSFNNAFASNSFGYFVGGRLYFDIGKLSFNTNLHFENINQNLAARTFTNKVYDFNSITEITTIKNKSIDYTIIGLNAMYPVYRNHSLGLGIQYAQLIQSNDLLSVYNLENNTNTNKNTNDYSSVLNKNDWQLTFSYQNRFTKHFAVNATYVFGLNDITKNTDFNSKEDYNSGFKLGLQYIIK